MKLLMPILLCASGVALAQPSVDWGRYREDLHRRASPIRTPVQQPPITPATGRFVDKDFSKLHPAQKPSVPPMFTTPPTIGKK